MQQYLVTCLSGCSVGHFLSPVCCSQQLGFPAVLCCRYLSAVPQLFLSSYLFRSLYVPICCSPAVSGVPGCLLLTSCSVPVVGTCLLFNSCSLALTFPTVFCLICCSPAVSGVPGYLLLTSCSAPAGLPAVHLSVSANFRAGTCLL